MFNTIAIFAFISFFAFFLYRIFGINGMPQPPQHMSYEEYIWFHKYSKMMRRFTIAKRWRYRKFSEQMRKAPTIKLPFAPLYSIYSGLNKK